MSLTRPLTLRGALGFEQQRKKAINALTILRSAIGLQPFRCLCRGPAVERFSSALKLIERNRIRNAVHPNMYESTRTRIHREQLHELSVTRIFGCDDHGIAVYAHDFGWPLKSAEHEDNSAILANMGGRFCATAGEILVNHFKRTKSSP
jgi:hypothetical protein